MDRQTDGPKCGLQSRVARDKNDSFNKHKEKEREKKIGITRTQKHKG